MWTLRSRFLAAMYDSSVAAAEKSCLGVWRSRILADAYGSVLDIGAGTGANLCYYPMHVERLVLTEPNDEMRCKLEDRIADFGRRDVVTAGDGAEALSYPDASFDCVVATLVLCSVNDQATSLGEIKRVLKPGGTLLFLEHVVAADARTARWQRFIQPLWLMMSHNCHLSRDTESAIRTAGFSVESIEELEGINMTALTRRFISGRARKPYSPP